MWLRIGIDDPATQRGELESLCGGLWAAPDRECGGASSKLLDQGQWSRDAHVGEVHGDPERNAPSPVIVRSINEKIL